MTATEATAVDRLASVIRAVSTIRRRNDRRRGGTKVRLVFTSSRLGPVSAPTRRGGTHQGCFTIARVRSDSGSDPSRFEQLPCSVTDCGVHRIHSAGHVPDEVVAIVEIHERLRFRRPTVADALMSPSRQLTRSKSAG